jgi:hypothetical protein
MIPVFMELQAYDATEVMRLQANDAVGFMELVYEGTSQLCYRSNEASSQ